MNNLKFAATETPLFVESFPLNLKRKDLGDRHTHQGVVKPCREETQSLVGPLWAPWALVGRALVGPMGPCGPPWAIVGRALVGPGGPAAWGKPGPP